MKKFFYYLLVVPLLWGCGAKSELTSAEKDAIKAKAEGVFLTHVRHINELKFDSAERVFSKDIYYVVDRTVCSYDFLIKWHRDAKKTVKVWDMKVDSMHSRLITPEAVLVTVYYSMFRVDTANNEFFTKETQTLLINPQLKEGNMLSCYETVDHTHIRYSENVPKEFQKDYFGLTWRHNFCLHQFQYLWLHHMSLMKQKGISPAASGELLGKTWAPGWDKSKGFDDLSTGMLFIAEAAWARSKVLERNKDLLRIEYAKDFKNVLPSLKISDEEAVTSFISCWNVIAEYMGSTTSLENKDKTFIVTFKRK